jgi:hypothetical protein
VKVYVRSDCETTADPAGLTGGDGAVVKVEPLGIQTQ